MWNSISEDEARSEVEAQCGTATAKMRLEVKWRLSVEQQQRR